MGFSGKLAFDLFFLLGDGAVMETITECWTTSSGERTRIHHGHLMMGVSTGQESRHVMVDSSEQNMIIYFFALASVHDL